MVRRLPAGHNCCVSRNLRMQTSSLLERGGLHWSSFLNNFEAGNSRVDSREFPKFRNKCYGRGGGVGRGRGVGVDRGDCVAVGVAVAVGVPVAVGVDVAVGVAVAVTVAVAVAVGLA